MVEGRMRVSLPVKEGVKGIRIDPAETSCMVRMLAARLNEEELPLSEPAYLAMNGWELSKKRKPIRYSFSILMIRISISGWKRWSIAEMNCWRWNLR